MRPLIGVTVDVEAERLALRHGYVEMIDAAGGAAVLLAPQAGGAADLLERLDGLLLSGGDDPAMEPFGMPTHPRAKRLDPRRQSFELELLERAAALPELPVLGVCLGMQLMALAAGGQLDQNLPESLPTAGRHWGRVEHEVSGELGSGDVLSHHRQAITEAGSMRVIARAFDDVIEAVRGEQRSFYLGVQWHPERTADGRLGAGLIRDLVGESATYAMSRGHR